LEQGSDQIVYILSTVKSEYSKIQKQKSIFTQIITTDLSKSKNQALNSYQKRGLKQRKRSNHQHAKHIQIIKVLKNSKNS